MKIIGNSISETITTSDLKDLSIDIAEVFTDDLLKDGILKELPIIKTIYSIYKTGLSIKDKLFVNKLLYFLNEIKEIEIEKRIQIVNEIDNSEIYKTKVGEKLLFIIDRVDDYEKSQIVGRLFKALLTEIIDYDLFIRCSKITENVLPEDLYYFVNSKIENYKLVDISEYINWGVIEFKPFNLEIVQRQNYDYREDQEKWYELENTEIECQLSFLGKKLREALK
jgi:hypothetical protein